MNKTFAANAAGALAAALLAFAITGCGSVPPNLAPELSVPARGSF